MACDNWFSFQGQAWISDGIDSGGGYTENEYILQISALYEIFLCHIPE